MVVIVVLLVGSLRTETGRTNRVLNTIHLLLLLLLLIDPSHEIGVLIVAILTG